MTASFRTDRGPYCLTRISPTLIIITEHRTTQRRITCGECSERNPVLLASTKYSARLTIWRAFINSGSVHYEDGKSRLTPKKADTIKRQWTLVANGGQAREPRAAEITRIISGYSSASIVSRACQARA